VEQPTQVQQRLQQELAVKIKAMIRLLLVNLLIILLAGCQAVPKAEIMAVRDLKILIEGPKGVGSPTFLGFFYCGDYAGFSYFVLRRSADLDRWIKINTSSWPVSKRMNFVRDDNFWVESYDTAAALP
jgi:hypothetical protein